MSRCCAPHSPASAIPAPGVYQQDFKPLAGRYLLHGDPDTVVARLAEYQAAGADTVIFSPACAAGRRDEVARLFAEALSCRGCDMPCPGPGPGTRGATNDHHHPCH